MDGTKRPKETLLGVNVFTAPGKAMVGERPRPFGEALGFDPITSTLIFGEHDAVLVDAMMTVAEAEALANWVALHNRSLRRGNTIKHLLVGPTHAANSIGNHSKPLGLAKQFL